MIDSLPVSLWLTLRTSLRSWRMGCRPLHRWGRAEELEAKLGAPEPHIKQCRRCGVIRAM